MKSEKIKRSIPEENCTAARRRFWRRTAADFEGAEWPLVRNEWDRETSN